MDLSNFDPSLLTIEASGNGMIWGTSKWGYAQWGASTGWVDIKTDFTSIGVTRSVTLNNAVLISPQASQLSMTILPGSVPTYWDSLYNKRVRVRYNLVTLFDGNIKSSPRSAVKWDSPDKPLIWTVSLQANDRTELLSKTIYEGFTAPQETATLRVDRLWPDAVVTGLGRQMAATVDPTNLTALAGLQGASDASFARFFVAADNTVVLDNSAPAEPTVSFDDLGVGIGIAAFSADQNNENAVSQATVNCASDDTFTRTTSVSGAVNTHAEDYTIDLLADDDELADWLLSFPFKGVADVQPTSISPVVTQSNLATLLGVELCDLINITIDGRSYEAGVQSITHTINGNPKTWTIEFGLMPGYIIRHTNIEAPSAPRAFGSNGKSDTTASFGWTVPASTGTMTGYRIAYNVGTVPPVSPTTGAGYADFALSAVSGTISGLTKKTRYAFAIFALTADPSAYSDSATAIVATRPVIPTVPTSVSNFSSTSTSLGFQWSAPVQHTDQTDYYAVLTRTSDGAFVSDAVLTTATTNWTFTGLTHGTNYTFTIVARAYDALNVVYWASPNGTATATP